MNTILIGYMGSGKTTLGKALAKRLDMEFIDTDQYIERLEGKTISEIFAEAGEDHFRKLEKEVVSHFINSDNLLLSVGGGMPCFNNVIENLNSLGFTIYLQRSPRELMYRIKNSKKKRPLTENKTDEELLQYIQNSLHAREVFYHQAQFIANRDQQNTNSLELIIRAQKAKSLLSDNDNAQ